jgi:hypothetical protein
MSDGHDPIEQTERRVRALGDEPIPSDVRDRHLLRIRTHEPAGAPPSRTPAPARGWRRRLAPLTAAATALVLFGGGGTVVAAAQDAVPDDALYGVKRASEQVWVGLPRGRERAAEMQLAMAERRLDEARRAPDHAPRLIGEGVENAEAAAEELPEEAIETFGRLLGKGEGSLPEQASPRARQALHRNCVRIAGKHGLSAERCGGEPDAGDHPGRGPRADVGRGQGRDGAPGREGAPGQLGERGPRMDDGEHPGRGWGPGGRPEGTVGPPPGTPGRGEPDLEDGEG